MITTRIHGLIDWIVAALFGAGSATDTLSSSVRTVLKTASAWQASSAAATDYEAGVRPWLTMRQHLLLDALGGVALIGAGVMMRRQPPSERALLVAAGLAGLAVVAYSETPGPEPDAEPATYDPLDALKPVADDVFIVDGSMPGLMGRMLPVRMTVIRLANGDVLLHSPIRFSNALKDQLQTLGRIAHLVAPNTAHWTFLQGWQQACPTATTWAIPGLRQREQVKRSGVRLDYDLGETAPDAWGSTVKLIMVPGGLSFHEAALFHQPSRTLVLTDLVTNLELAKVPLIMRPVVRAFGMGAPDGMPPPYLRAVVKLRRKDAMLAASSLLDLDPERVIFAHGRWFEADGAQALRRSLRWLLA
jgi:hypothetical protein